MTLLATTLRFNQTDLDIYGLKTWGEWRLPRAPKGGKARDAEPSSPRRGPEKGVHLMNQPVISAKGVPLADQQLVVVPAKKHGLVRLPLVSVIVTNFNYGRYVLAAIDSVRRQDYQRLECVIIDDNSTDGSYELIVNHLASINDDRFRAIRLGKNLGQMGAIKAGLENVTGTFVVMLDADDMLRENFVSSHLRAHLNGAYTAGLSASDTIQIDEDGNILEATYHTLDKHRSDDPQAPIRPVLPAALNKLGDDDLILTAPADDPVYYVDRSVGGWHGVAMSAFMFRRDLLELIVPDDPAPFRICADYYLIMFGHKITGMLTIWNQLSYFRLHRKNTFSNNPVIGSQHLTGWFADEHRISIERQIPAHIATHFDQCYRVLGHRVIELVRHFCPPNEFRAFVQQHPKLQPFISFPSRSKRAIARLKKTGKSLIPKMIRPKSW
jgi:glycosyltransferase involved in cell wall biosynthesis